MNPDSLHLDPDQTLQVNPDPDPVSDHGQF
jgi:hypothetical protein